MRERGETAAGGWSWWGTGACRTRVSLAHRKTQKPGLRVATHYCALASDQRPRVARARCPRARARRSVAVESVRAQAPARTYRASRGARLLPAATGALFV